MEPSTTPAVATEKPRLRHNRELMLAYLAANKVHARYPKVTDQVETVPAPTTYRWGYNPTIIQFEGQHLMAYRYHEKTLATKLALVGFAGTEVPNQPIEVPDAQSAEDPKFFEFSQELYLSYVVSQWPNMTKSVVRYGRLDHGKILDPVQPKFGDNDWSTVEKNWVFWSEPDDKLKCIYMAGNPKARIYTPCSFESDGPCWPYGPIKGGTRPVVYRGKWLRFFHSTLDNDLGIAARRYYIGALLMETTPPYKTVCVSRKPIIYGSEIDNLPKEERKACFHWKPNVVFPGGVIEKEGCWWLAVGVNDSAYVIAKVKPEQLQF